MNDDDSPLNFPCEFPIKAMGRSRSGLEDTVWDIIHAHAPDTGRAGVGVTESRNGRFISVTVTITDASRAQLDAIYADLQGHDDVLATL